VSEQIAAAPTAAPPLGAEREQVRRGRRWAGGAGKRRLSSLDVLTIVLVAVLVLRPLLTELVDSPAVQTWSTIFVSIVVQALPFLVLGVMISGAIASFVPAETLAKALPKRPALAVPVAGAAGVALPGCECGAVPKRPALAVPVAGAAGLALPGCECGAVPIAGGLISRGVMPAAALAFLLSAPAINPVVLVATAVAFPGRPEVVGARFLASLATALVMGWLWARFGRTEWMARPHRPDLEGLGRWTAFRVSARHDFVHAGGFLVVGGLTAATLNVVVPRTVLESVADSPVLSVLVLAGLAVILAICSEADAFVAASLTEFSLTSRLAFMVVGPAVDVKLVSLQAGTFGKSFAVRFAPMTFLVAVVASVLTGWWLL